MVDSGGFALMANPDARWALRDVSKFIEDLDAEIFVSLDYPPAKTDSKKTRERKIVRSAKNFTILTERFSSKTIMPVVHGRTISEIDQSIQLIGKAVSNPSWVGLGGIVPLLQHRITSREIARLSPEAFIAFSLAKIRKAFPNAKIHAFGAGGTQTFPAVIALGADSADSIGWRQAAGFGSIFLPLKSQRVIKWNLEKRPPRRLLDDSDIAELELCACPICTERPIMASRLADFRSSFHNRSIHNAWAVTHQMEYWPPGRSGIRNLVSKGNLGLAWAKALDLV
jgi:queuine/archaeosine tRNA-ribosyltransferase